MYEPDTTARKDRRTPAPSTDPVDPVTALGRSAQRAALGAASEALHGPAARVGPCLLNAVAGLLEAHSIEHGELREGPEQLNLNVADEQRVLVKISRPNPAALGPNRECELATLAADAGLVTPRPLLGPAMVLDDADQQRFVTVWPWVASSRRPTLALQGVSLVDAVAELGALPTPETLPQLDLVFQAERVASRMAGRTDPTARRITAVATAAFDRVGELAAARTSVWLHGDMHLGNVLWGAGAQRVLIDWEGSCRGPVEWDVAQVLRSVLTYPTNGTAALSVPTRLDAATAALVCAGDLDIEWDLLWQALRARTASAASHMVLVGRDPEVVTQSLALLQALDEGLGRRLRRRVDNAGAVSSLAGSRRRQPARAIG